MRLFSTDPSEPGVFAVGQVAVGIFAFGQLSLGVVAIGQVARGVIAIGQLAVGIVAIGQAALGVLYAGGMISVGGRGFGICLRLLPKVVVERFQRPQLPPIGSVADVLAKGRGWVLAHVTSDGLAVDGLSERAAPPLELGEEARPQLDRARAEGHTHACLTLRVEERAVDEEVGYREAVPRARALRVARLSSWLERPPQLRLEGPLTSAVGLLVRAVAMCGVIAAWYYAVGFDLLDRLGLT